MTARTILICLHDFSRGGTERIAIGLAANWVDAGRDVTILCGNEQGGLRDMVDPRVNVVVVDPPIPRVFPACYFLLLPRARLAPRRGGGGGGVKIAHPATAAGTVEQCGAGAVSPDSPEH